MKILLLIILLSSCSVKDMAKEVLTEAGGRKTCFTLRDEKKVEKKYCVYDISVTPMGY